jgi:hypothetical protein
VGGAEIRYQDLHQTAQTSDQGQDIGSGDRSTLPSVGPAANHAQITDDVYGLLDAAWTMMSVVESRADVGMDRQVQPLGNGRPQLVQVDENRGHRPGDGSGE